MRAAGAAGGGGRPGVTHLLMVLPSLLAVCAALQEVALLARVRRLRPGLDRVPGCVGLRFLADSLLESLLVPIRLRGRHCLPVRKREDGEPKALASP